MVLVFKPINELEGKLLMASEDKLLKLLRLAKSAALKPEALAFKLAICEGVKALMAESLKPAMALDCNKPTCVPKALTSAELRPAALLLKEAICESLKPMGLAVNTELCKDATAVEVRKAILWPRLVKVLVGKPAALLPKPCTAAVVSALTCEGVKLTKS